MLIKAIHHAIHNLDDQELLLMAFRLLKDYDDALMKDIGDRRRRYVLEHKRLTKDEIVAYRTSFYDGWITDRGWTDYCVFFHEESKDGLPVLIFFYNPSKDPNDDLWYVSAYILSNGVFMGSSGILDSSELIDRCFESIKKWA